MGYYFSRYQHSSALRWPWVVLNVSLYAFAIPWMIAAIVIRYFISNDYDSTLPGLDSSIARKFFISAHMGLGLVCLVLYPLQFFVCVRKRFPLFHRWSGRISLLSAVLTSICGIIFIFLKRFRLVGGLNMGISFFFYGFVLGSCAIMTGYYARKRQFQRHRNWAIRSYSQILATMLYRYYYALLIGLRLIHEPEGELECDEKDVCSYFLKSFDSIHAWTFFLFPLLVAEFTIHLTCSHDKSESNILEGITEQHSFHSPITDLECTNEEYIALQNHGSNDETMITTRRRNQTNANTSDDQSAYFYLNMTGIIFAAITIGSTLVIFVTSALGVNTISFN